MNNADYVAQQAEALKKSEKTLWMAVWKVALLCVGWAYVFGARGALCTPANRRAAYKSHGADHPTIKTKCKGFDSGVCTGCKWFPGSKRTRDFDCRGFVYWVIYIVTGWKLQGAGSNSQWNTKSNWKAQGKIATCPADMLVLLFQYRDGKMIHVGFGYGNETCECQVGVQHKTKRETKWTHWGIPVCFDNSYKIPAEKPKEEKPVKKYQTIKRGNHGEAVKQCQTMLQKLGYDLGVCGVDSDFGIATDKAVRQFQKDQGLKVDGIVGEKTWAALEKATAAPAPVEKLYTVTVKNVKKAVADEIVAKYGGTMTAQ